MRLIFDTRRMISGSVWSSFSEKLKNWSVNKKKIIDVSTINFEELLWMSTDLLWNRPHRIIVKTYVFSMRCVGKMGIRETITFSVWIDSTGCRRSSSEKYSQELQCWTFSRRFKILWQIHSEHFNERVIFKSMYNDVDWKAKRNKKKLITIHKQMWNMLVNPFTVIGLSWAWIRNKLVRIRNDHGIEWKRIWWQIFLDPFIRHFVSPVPLRNRIAKQKKGQKTILLNDNNENIELVLRTVISSNPKNI